MVVPAGYHRLCYSRIVRQRIVLGLVACGLVACGGDERAAPAAAASIDAAAALTDLPSVPPKPPPPKTPEFPDGTRSLRLTKTIAVRLRPGRDAKQIGTIAEDTRVAWTATEKAAGCKQPWVEITPRGWVCGEYLEPNTRGPIGVELPRLERGDIVPGEYGRIIEAGATTYVLPDKKAKKDDKKKPKKADPPPPDAGVPPAGEGFGSAGGPVTSPDQVDPAAPVEVASSRVPDPMVPGRPLLGSVTVRKYGELAFGDKVYWKISRGNEYVALKSIRVHEPSEYHGLRLGDDTGLRLPVAFVWPKSKDAKHVWIRKNAALRGALRQVEVRTPFAILETVEANGAPVAYRVGEGEWIEASQVRVAREAPPPPIVQDGERWFDVDLDTQVLVAYEGTMPVYTTMISSGRKDHATPTGVWRMEKKLTETDMNGVTGEDPYSVSTVPWTQFFHGVDGLALHAAYWHDGFGKVKSHGCVNLSPADARWLYFWSAPMVPPGWTLVAGVVEAPGSVVRVRSKADPEPALKGYAIKVEEAR